MTVKLNPKALTHARALIKAGTATQDSRDDWGEHAPSADDENAYLDTHGYTDYALWYLGIDEEKSEETKGRYSFPYGDFTRLYRSAIIAIESRAAQNDHDDIRDAAGTLLKLIDKD